MTYRVEFTVDFKVNEETDMAQVAVELARFADAVRNNGKLAGPVCINRKTYPWPPAGADDFRWNPELAEKAGE